MEELQREVAKLKIELKNLRSIVDELGYMVVNHPSFLAQEDTETLIRKSQNTLKILDKFCQMLLIFLTSYIMEIDELKIENEDLKKLVAYLRWKLSVIIELYGIK